MKVSDLGFCKIVYKDLNSLLSVFTFVDVEAIVKCEQDEKGKPCPS